MPFALESDTIKWKFIDRIEDKMTDLFSKIKEVTELQALPGFEGPVRNYLRQRLTPHVDRVETDGLGGIFGIKESPATDAPRLMVAAHMDEVGFMISDIKADGTFRAVELGGLEPCCGLQSGLQPDSRGWQTNPRYLRLPATSSEPWQQW